MQSWVSNCREFAFTVNSCDSCGALYCRVSSPHCSSICSCIWTTKSTSAWGTHWSCWVSVTSSWSHWPLPNANWHKAHNAWGAGGRLVLESCSLKTVGKIVIFTHIWTIFSWAKVGFCNLCPPKKKIVLPSLVYVMTILFFVCCFSLVAVTKCFSWKSDFLCFTTVRLDGYKIQQLLLDFFFFFKLTVHLSIILVINQLDAQNLVLQ